MVSATLSLFLLWADSDAWNCSKHPMSIRQQDGTVGLQGGEVAKRRV